MDHSDNLLVLVGLRVHGRQLETVGLGITEYGFA